MRRAETPKLAHRVHEIAGMLQDHASRPYWRSAFRRDRRRLVIADDSDDMRWLVRTAIGNDFADVIEVADGRALLWTLLRSSFAAAPGTVPELVVITDLTMPAYDGLDVLDAWRDLAPDVPMIIITAYPSPAVYARADELGASVLAKPFLTAELRRLVDEVTHGRRTV
jgi:CheY-like chemotaxis protein